jgi:hypothetical protein
VRQSAGKVKELHITKEGSRWLRWSLVQLAWRLVNKLAYWARLFERLRQRTGKKKAIVAVAVHAWRVIVAMLKSGKKYQFGGRGDAAGQERGLGLTPKGPKVEKTAPATRAGHAKVLQPDPVASAAGKPVRAVARQRGVAKRRKADAAPAFPPPSGPAPALGSHPCVALSSGQATCNKAHQSGKVKRAGGRVAE